MAIQSTQRFKDETGKRHGKLTVLRFDEMRKGQPYWTCQCDCGREVSVRGANLRSGNTKSCGCSRRTSAQHFRGRMVLQTLSGNFVFGKADPTSKNTLWVTFCRFCGRVGLHKERTLRKGKALFCACRKPTRNSWRSMIERCTNRNHRYFKKYGGCGITVCEKWRRSFFAFVEDMGIRPKGMTIDRINNDRGYYPGNCQWATPEQQAANRRKPCRK
jgi:hypothetical protein